MKPRDGRKNWIDISDQIDMSLPKSQRLQVGQTLTFNQEGSLHSYKIMRIPKNGRLWVRPVTLLDPGHYGHNVDNSEDAIQQYGLEYCTDCEVTIDQPVRA